MAGAVSRRLWAMADRSQIIQLPNFDEIITLAGAVGLPSIRPPRADYSG